MYECAVSELKDAIKDVKACSIIFDLKGHIGDLVAVVIRFVDSKFNIRQLLAPRGYARPNRAHGWLAVGSLLARTGSLPFKIQTAHLDSMGRRIEACTNEPED